jgi:hypothetical protein
MNNIKIDILTFTALKANINQKLILMDEYNHIQESYLLFEEGEKIAVQPDF